MSHVKQTLVSASMYNGLSTAARSVCGVLIAPCPSFRRSDLIHFGNPLLEFFVLALLVAMSLLLKGLYQLLDGPGMFQLGDTPRISTEDSIHCIGTY